ncbi:MAG: glucose 1-dehydrogenase [Chloroflexota bacterium]|nr:glucose 1-dehydrogenase [Chloroflexota bacterium]
MTEQEEHSGRLAARVAFITGAGSGIGQASALLFAQEGAGVCAVDLDPASAQTTAGSLTALGGQALSAAADVSASDQVRRAVEACLQHFGRIDILVNCAGIGSTQTVVDTAEDLWERVFAVNVRGTFLCCKTILSHMIEAGGGTIINIASVAGMVGLKNRAAYCASKGAVISLTQAIAVDHVGQHIRCNCICPGTVDSPWVGRLLAAAPDPAAERAALVARQPMGRLGSPEEIARAALYLASDDAAFITGSSLVIDGGLTAQ